MRLEFVANLAFFEQIPHASCHWAPRAGMAQKKRQTSVKPVSAAGYGIPARASRVWGGPENAGKIKMQASLHAVSVEQSPCLMPFAC
jgi:hypothetical protein